MKSFKFLLLALFLTVNSMWCFDSTEFEEKMIERFYEEAADSLYNDLIKTVYSKYDTLSEVERVVIRPFNNDKKDKFYASFSAKFNNNPSFKIYERKNIESVLEELAQQNEDYYSADTKSKIGEFTGSQAVISGDTDLNIETTYGKKRIKFTVSAEFHHLESAERIWSKSIELSKKIKYPLYVYIIVLGAAFLLLVLFNFLFRGRVTTFLIVLFILFVFLFSIWFFIL